MQDILRNEELGYNPATYSFSDYNLFQYANETHQRHQNPPNGRVTYGYPLQTKVVSSLQAIKERYLARFQTCAKKDKNFNFVRFASICNALISKVDNDAFDSWKVISGSLKKLRSGLQTLVSEEKDDSEYTELLLDFITTLDVIKKSVCGSINPMHFSPEYRSATYLAIEWERITNQDISTLLPQIIDDLNSEKQEERDRTMEYLKRGSERLAEIQAANLRLISTAPYTRRCLAHFEPHPGLSSGLLLRIYDDRRFQHWLCQMVLAVIFLTAIAILTALTVKATLLPLAVATVVTGLSKFAANVIFGMTLTIGITAAVALGASLHARFFSHRPPKGGGNGAESNLANEHNRDFSMSR